MERFFFVPLRGIEKGCEVRRGVRGWDVLQCV